MNLISIFCGGSELIGLDFECAYDWGDRIVNVEPIIRDVRYCVRASREEKGSKWTRLEEGVGTHTCMDRPKPSCSISGHTQVNHSQSLFVFNFMSPLQCQLYMKPI